MRYRSVSLPQVRSLHNPTPMLPRRYARRHNACQCLCMYICMYVCMYACMHVRPTCCLDPSPASASALPPACMHACLHPLVPYTNTLTTTHMMTLIARAYEWRHMLALAAHIRICVSTSGGEGKEEGEEAKELSSSKKAVGGSGFHTHTHTNT